MSNEIIIRAWKNEDFRNSLSTTEQSFLPDSPAGLVEIPDNALKDVGGGVKQCFPTWGRVCGNGKECELQ